MTAPAGAEVGLYVDVIGRVAPGDVVETQSGRRYAVVGVRVQERGKRAGRNHLRAVVMSPGDPLPLSGMLWRIRWYRRQRSTGIWRGIDDGRSA